jgi:hypothetical protein
MSRDENAVERHQVAIPYRKFNMKHNAWLILVAVVTLVAEWPVASQEPQRPSEFYKPEIRSVEGWTVKVDPELLTDGNRELCDAAFKALANHLQRITYIVSADRLADLRKIPIWVDMTHSLEYMQYHPSERWLTEHGYNPELAGHVHIPRARSLIDRSMWAKHPYVVLHELAHAYHDQILGFDNAEIESVFGRAAQSGIYEKVLDHTGQTVKHYGLTNAKEYFAESTESYLGVNDFYPFVRAELRQHDPEMYALMEKIWGPIR